MNATYCIISLYILVIASSSILLTQAHTNLCNRIFSQPQLLNARLFPISIGVQAPPASLI